MKKYLIIPLALLISGGLSAQGLYNNGAKIVVGSGTYLCVNGTGGNVRNETNVSNGAIKLDGTLKVSGNYTNNVTAADILVSPAAGSTVAFIGTASQTLGGTTTTPFTFDNLTVNNSAGITMANNSQVNGVLALTSGRVTLGTKNLALGLSATIAGTPSAGAMVVATGTGELRKAFSGFGSFTFPVGDNNGTAEYSPVTLNFTSGTFGGGAYAGVSLANTAYPDPLVNTSYLNRYWNVSQSGITGFSCNAAFNYLVSDVVGTEADIAAVRITPAPAVFYDAANTSLHQLTASNLSSFGTFTGALGFRMLSLKLYLEGLYLGGGMMNPAYDFNGVDLAPKWGPAIADHITVELHDAANYMNVLKVLNDVPLNTDGTAEAQIPNNYRGNYYITIKHRNSIETVCAAPQSFSGSVLGYDFSDAATKAFGDNVKSLGGGIFGLYVGDITDLTSAYPDPPVQDGIVDILDLYYVYPSYLAGDLGYLPSDLNGDGVVDVLDLYLDYNNYLSGIYAMTP
jgi:hypothetical protein